MIKEAESSVTIEEATKSTKKVFEQKIASDILTFLQNLDDFDEADVFLLLYTKALNRTLEFKKEDYRIDEEDVRKMIAETDERFVYGEEICEKCEEE